MKKSYVFVCLVLMAIFSFDGYSQQYYNYNTGGGGNAFPFNIYPGTRKTIHNLYLPGAFSSPNPAPAGNITKLYFRASSSGSATYTSISIRMGLTTDVDLP